LLATAAVVALATMLVGPTGAQDVVEDEGAAYRAWHAASQAGDGAKALAAAEAYLKAYPTGQYADFLKKWVGPVRVNLLNEAIKAGRTADMVKVGKEILAADPENLAVLITLASQLRGREMLANPASYEHAADAVEFSTKAIALVESGKVPAGVASFDKNASLGLLTQVVALNEAKNGSADKAITLFEQSTALAPADVNVAGRNLLSLVALRNARYSEAAKAYNAIPEADRAAAEPKAEVKAARELVDKEADGLIDSAARFVALATAKNLPAATRDRINGVLESVYKTRHPEDSALEGLKKLIEEKAAAIAGNAPGA
jgi:hypothetical protein